MRIALTGGSGFIGREIVRRLAAEGHEIVVLVRRPESVRDLVDAGACTAVPGAMEDGDARRRLLDQAEAVVHNAFDWAALRDGPRARHIAVNITASLELIAESGDLPLTYLSSVAVHHEMLAEWGGAIDESHPTRPGSAYGAAKVAVEAHLFAERARGRSVCMLRPSAVYGMDPDPARVIGRPIVDRLRERGHFSRAGGGKFVHVADVAEAVAGAIRLGAEAPLVVHLADCYARWGDLARWAAEIMGIEADIDLSSPSEPRNHFTKDAARALGVSLDRGHEGLRAHLRDVIAV